MVSVILFFQMDQTQGQWTGANIDIKWIAPEKHTQNPSIMTPVNEVKWIKWYLLTQLKVLTGQITIINLFGHCYHCYYSFRLVYLPSDCLRAHLPPRVAQGSNSCVLGTTIGPTVIITMKRERSGWPFGKEDVESKAAPEVVSLYQKWTLLGPGL